MHAIFSQGPWTTFSAFSYRVERLSLLLSKGSGAVLNCRETRLLITNSSSIILASRLSQSCSFKLDHLSLSKVVSKNPRVLKYVRILQIEIEIGRPSILGVEEAQAVRKQLEKFKFCQNSTCVARVGVHLHTP